MGTCYSKTGHDIPPDREKRPKDKKKDSHKNGHANSLKRHQLMIEFPVQKDLSDTVYTEDSHIILTDSANCINKSQQTSLDQLSKDPTKTVENGNNIECEEGNDCVVINCKSPINSKSDVDCDSITRTEISKLLSLNPLDGTVSTSDSGIVVESVKGCDIVEKTNNVCDDYSQDFEDRVDSITDDATTAEVEQHKETEQSYSEKCTCELKTKVETKHCDSPGHRPLTDHSNTCQCHEGEHRQSLASIDRLSESTRGTESTTDLDKIRLAIQQNSVGTLSEHRSFLDSSDTSYDLPTVTQPEITTMNMNGRDVVIIDADLFSQIIDEIQTLKIKLSQLTEVIQDTDDVDLPERGLDVSILSSSA